MVFSERTIPSALLFATTYLACGFLLRTCTSCLFSLPLCVRRSDHHAYPTASQRTHTLSGTRRTHPWPFLNSLSWIFFRTDPHLRRLYEECTIGHWAPCVHHDARYPLRSLSGTETNTIASSGAKSAIRGTDKHFSLRRNRGSILLTPEHECDRILSSTARVYILMLIYMSIQMSMSVRGEIGVLVMSMRSSREPVSIKEKRVRRQTRTHIHTPCRGNGGTESEPEKHPSTIRCTEAQSPPGNMPGVPGTKEQKTREPFGGVASSHRCERAVSEENVPTADPASTLSASIGDVVSPASLTTWTRGSGMRTFYREGERLPIRAVCQAKTV